MSDAIAQLLAGRYPDPDGGPALAVPTRAVAIADSLDGREDELVKSLDLGRRLAVVSDPTTRAVLGERVERALAAVGEVQAVVLGEHPHADMETVEAIRAASSGADALIAVGSGTIGDLCKYAAFRDGKPYAVFGTAPSMNGYSSISAAITEKGLKKSLPAAAAAGVFLDLTVLAAAPPRMIRAGLGDSLCRPTAQADWLLAHLLRDQPYRNAPFALLADDEDLLFAQSDALMAGDLEIMACLARSLVLSGFGMTICGGSHSASQGEHLISHYLDMRGGELSDSLHGEQIAVTTLTMARLQEELLERGPPRVQPTRMDEATLAERFGAELGALCWASFAPKRLDAEAAARLERRIAGRWDCVVLALTAVTRRASELERVLMRAGAPRRPADLGWPAGLYAEAVSHARFIRDRYTALDLAGDAGLLDGFAARLAAPAPATQ